MLLVICCVWVCLWMLSCRIVRLVVFAWLLSVGVPVIVVFVTVVFVNLGGAMSVYVRVVPVGIVVVPCIVWLLCVMFACSCCVSGFCCGVCTRQVSVLLVCVVGQGVLPVIRL